MKITKKCSVGVTCRTCTMNRQEKMSPSKDKLQDFETEAKVISCNPIRSSHSSNPGIIYGSKLIEIRLGVNHSEHPCYHFI